MASKIDQFCALFKSIQFKVQKEPEKPVVTKETLSRQNKEKVLIELNKALARAKAEFNSAKKMHKHGKMSASELFDFEVRLQEIRDQISRIKEDDSNNFDEFEELGGEG